ncbi:hypothetical protein PINS_up021219 [Pythium insidiosum]|nr:hypothetical protein PINS_up021219 [Pythium insidiosum]
MLGGHDHEPFTLYEGKTLIHKSGQNAFWLARLELHLHRAPAQLGRPLAVMPQWRMIANRNIPPQPSCQQIVLKYMKQLADEENAEESKRVLATLALPLSTKTSQLRGGECNMGNLAADALRSELSADFGLINGGFIRGDKLYEARTNITVGVLNHEMPFPRPAVLVRLKARYFRDAILQHLSKYPQLSGSYPHVSGVKVVVERADGELRVVSFEDQDGQSIDLESTVQVATTMFIANGGDGCTAWQRGEIVQIREKISVVVGEFLLKKRLVAYPEHEGRLSVRD